MLSSSFLDIAIGVIFVLLMLSFVASTVNEIIMSFLSMRGKELLRGLKALLDDPTADGLVKQVYNHGMIFGLFEGPFNPKKPGNLPSYIPSRSFVAAFLDVLSPAPAADAPQADAVAARMRALRAAADKLASDPKTEKIGKPLTSLISSAGTDIDKLKTNLEDWYNSGMDRVSGWYKYRTQWNLFFIGLVLALLLNANTIHIVRQISKDPTIRQSLVAAAANVKLPDNPGQTLQQQLQDANSALKQIDDLGVPLGWQSAQATEAFASPSSWLGWLLTALAVSLGAPFWFDLLNKFMVVRSTIKPQEKSKNEASKDPTGK